MPNEPGSNRLQPWTDAIAEMSGRNPTDPERLAQVLPHWLRERWPAAAHIAVGDFSIPAATGNSNETVIFRAKWQEQGRTGDDRYVLRIEPATPPLFPQQTFTPMPSVEIQYRAMQVVGQHGVPLAPLVGYEADPAVLGRPFFVMGYVDGQVPSDVPPYSLAGFLVDQASPAQRRCLVESGLDVLARLHRIDLLLVALHLA